MKTGTRKRVSRKPTAKSVAVKRIHFVDRGQDFLAWDIDQWGMVLDSQPFQSSIWADYWVLNHDRLKVGMKVVISKSPDDPSRSISYPVERIENLKPTTK